MSRRQAGAVGSLVALMFLGWFYFAGGQAQFFDSQMRELDAPVAAEMQRSELKVAQDAAKQYEIAKRHGSALDACSAAQYATAAYLQAKSEPDYEYWKSIEKSDCRRAGLRLP